MTVLFGPPHTFASILWSVSIEEQFYLSWPLAVKRLSRSSLILVAIALLLLANATRLYLSGRELHAYTVWPNTFAQLDPIAIGILVAVVLRGGVLRLNTKVRVVLAVTGIAVLVFCGHFSDATPQFTLAGYPVVSLLLGRALHGRTGTAARYGIYWVGGLALTIALASLSYRFLETPFLRMKERYSFVNSRPV
jgi:peptidoglycan/LPS O-acetylase OafA/YrhL